MLLLYYSSEVTASGQVWQYTPELRKLKQEDCCEFKASLGDTASSLKNKTETKTTHIHARTHVQPHTTTTTTTIKTNNHNKKLRNTSQGFTFLPICPAQSQTQYDCSSSMFYPLASFKIPHENSTIIQPWPEGYSKQ